MNNNKNPTFKKFSWLVLIVLVLVLGVGAGSWMLVNKDVRSQVENFVLQGRVSERKGASPALSSPQLEQNAAVERAGSEAIEQIPKWKRYESAFLSAYRGDAKSQESLQILTEGLRNSNQDANLPEDKALREHARTLIFLGVGKIKSGQVRTDQFLTPEMKQLILAYQKSAPEEIRGIIENLPRESEFIKLMELAKNGES